MKLNIFWFRRDLRLFDNAGLYEALKSGLPVLPIFIFDTNILNELPKNDRRVDFIHRQIQVLKTELEKYGSSLQLFYGKPDTIFEQLAANFDIESVFVNHDYESYALQRDEKIKKQLAQKNTSFHTFKDQCIFEKDEILTDAQKPYTVFTPYSRKWKKTLTDFYVKAYPTEKYFHHFYKTPPFETISLEEMGFQKTDLLVPEKNIRVELLEKYAQNRDFPAMQGTSRLSVHLRFGTVSIRELVRVARQLEQENWLNELIWRDFYMMILWHFPQVVLSSFKPAYDKIVWRNDEKEFLAWKNGKTGYPLVDAGMRELNATGFMHNRVRMVVASFLTKHLLIDWRWGEAYFAEKLLDFELSSNNGGWQWASGSGCDAAPYFRIFSPEEQFKKFDAQQLYVKKWVAEWGTWEYRPIVEHKFARERALATYQKYLKE